MRRYALQWGCIYWVKIMNPYNLIDPFSPRDQLRLRLWKTISWSALGVSCIVLLGCTAQLSYTIFSIRRNCAKFETPEAQRTMLEYEQVCSQLRGLKEQISLITLLHKESFFYKHLCMIAQKIPAQVKLDFLQCSSEEITLEGQSQSLEMVLGFIHSLNDTELFQGINLIELKPSSLVYDEKKLVNFSVKGKLRGL